MKSALSIKEVILGTTGLVVTVQMLGHANVAANSAVEQVAWTVDDAFDVSFEGLALPELLPSIEPAEASNNEPNLTDVFEAADRHSLTAEGSVNPDELQLAAAAMLASMGGDNPIDVVAPDDNPIDDSAKSEELAQAEQMLAELMPADAVPDGLSQALAAEMLGGGETQAVLGEAKGLLGGILGKKKMAETIGRTAKDKVAIDTLSDIPEIGDTNGLLAQNNDAKKALNKVASAFPSLGKSKVVRRTRLAGLDAGLGESAASIRAVVNKKKGQIQYCYELLPKDTSASGKIGVMASISAGRVADISVSTDGVGSPRLINCMVSKMRRWRFSSDVSDSIHMLFSFHQS